MEKLQDVIVENGIVYRMGEDEIYYPVIRPEQGTHYPIGKYGIIIAEYIMENQRHKYIQLFMDGKWNEYLHECEEEWLKQEELLIQQIKEQEGITEQLKRDNPMEWVGRMNEVRIRVERMVVEGVTVMGILCTEKIGESFTI